jgi:hypothetical protein
MLIHCRFSPVLDDDYLSKRIVIENVTHYAYGQHDDGEVGIWVAGKAGWYSIVPARGYRAMYNDMVEAIDLLYFLVDRLQRTKRKRRSGGPTLEYLCDEVSRPMETNLLLDLVGCRLILNFFFSGSTSLILMAFAKMVMIR